MKIVQGAYGYAKMMIQKGYVLNFVMGLALLLLTVDRMYQTSRQPEQEERSPREVTSTPATMVYLVKAEVERINKRYWQNVLLSRKSAPGKVVPTETDQAAGAIYTRWGRTTCPTQLSKLVYHGFIGGQHWEYTGGGSNILCLPHDPEWANYTDVAENTQSIYSAQYILSHYTNTHTGLFSDANSKYLHSHIVPCAVCQTLTPATIMMLPARKTCYPGWTLEYSGYLMSEHYNSKGRGPFTCIDHAPEADPAEYQNKGGALIYNVQAARGYLPSPPYIDGLELTCSVCSQRYRNHVHEFGFDNRTKELADQQ